MQEHYQIHFLSNGGNILVLGLTSATAAKSQSSCNGIFENSMVWTTEGLPIVSVPVLSNTTAFTYVNKLLITKKSIIRTNVKKNKKKKTKIIFASSAFFSTFYLSKESSINMHTLLRCLFVRISSKVYCIRI